MTGPQRARTCRFLTQRLERPKLVVGDAVSPGRDALCGHDTRQEHARRQECGGGSGTPNCPGDDCLVDCWSLKLRHVLHDNRNIQSIYYLGCEGPGVHKEGHIGLGFLVYSPLAFVLAYHEMYVTFIAGCIAIQYWSHFPDIDLHLSFVEHRGITHTLFMALLAGVITAVVAVGLITADVLPATLFANEEVGVSTKELVGGFGFLVGVLGVTSHILGDLFTPMGVEPAAPISNANISLNLFRARNKTANRAFSKVGFYAIGVALVLGVLSSTGALQNILDAFRGIIKNLSGIHSE